MLYLLRDIDSYRYATLVDQIKIFYIDICIIRLNL